MTKELNGCPCDVFEAQEADRLLIREIEAAECEIKTWKHKLAKAKEKQGELRSRFPCLDPYLKGDIL